tara:strand:- start:288 stop:518 length:231 start_codon:yes stop_codon:yes gene_type:complete
MGLKGNSLILSAPVKRKLHAARPGMLPFSPETCAAVQRLVRQPLPELPWKIVQTTNHACLGTRHHLPKTSPTHACG